MKNELLAALGWIIGIQGALGFIGRTWSDGDWGLLHLWFTPPTALYIVMAVAGLAFGIAVDVRRKQEKRAAGR
ncbi:hypothetical protein ACIO3O_33105 [Streptomyces sp. NPDC087440]|uniref:hypothetical protein n=1 Tax=Streptomyces sp. NPDC087440 TaxID=3365790 RepID=UPI00381B4F33